jgi:hypothetical protein
VGLTTVAGCAVGTVAVGTVAADCAVAGDCDPFCSVCAWWRGVVGESVVAFAAVAMACADAADVAGAGVARLTTPAVPDAATAADGAGCAAGGTVADVPSADVGVGAGALDAITGDADRAALPFWTARVAVRDAGCVADVNVADAPVADVGVRDAGGVAGVGVADAPAAAGAVTEGVLAMPIPDAGAGLGVAFESIG